MFERITESAFDSQQFNARGHAISPACKIAGAGQRKYAWSQTAQRCRLPEHDRGRLSIRAPERERRGRCGQLVHMDVTVDRGKRQMR
jgi:hypothetical protein